MKRAITIKLWVAVLIGFVTLVVGAGIGMSGSADQTELKAAQAKAASAESDLADAKAAAAAAGTRADDAVAAARAQITEENKTTVASIDGRKAELDSQAAAIDARDTEVSAKEDAKRRSEFGDGVYEVNVDIVPGKYKSDSGERCYWEKTSKNGDIIDNDNVSGPVFVTIEASVYSFKATRCGTWRKTG